uniref:Calponin n=1 Tax=Vombatus ursinus TaxID=29139 RepID=A0A4X2K0G0_VOMUR
MQTSQNKSLIKGFVGPIQSVPLTPVCSWGLPACQSVPSGLTQPCHELHSVQQRPVLQAEVKNQLQSKYDPQMEGELRDWIKDLTKLGIGQDFQKGLKDGIISCTLKNKLQPGSMPKIPQNWHQLENLSNFIKAMVNYGMNPVDLFEANDLFESGNMTQVQGSLLALAGKMGTNKCASQSGMTAYGTWRHLYDPKNQILAPVDHSTIRLQMGTNKSPGTKRHIYNTKMGTDKCDNTSMSLQMGYTQGANQSGQVFGLEQQIYDTKVGPGAGPGDSPRTVEPPEYHYYQEEVGY